MKHLSTATMLLVALAMTSGASAAPRTVILSVKNMTCASCPFLVKKALIGVPGVSDVAVSFERKTARVTFDDTVAKVEDLTRATANAGYPASLAASGAAPGAEGAGASAQAGNRGSGAATSAATGTPRGSN